MNTSTRSLSRALAILCSGLLASCTAAAPDETAQPTTTPPVTTAVPAGEIVWTPVELGVDTAYVTVPVDYEDPSKGTLELFVARHMASDPSKRIGVLLVNPGGPGFGGSYMALEAKTVFAPMLLERFDIIGFDPRGTGDSRPVIDCIDDYDTSLLLDPTPDDAADLEAQRKDAKLFVETCIDSVDGNVMHFTTNNTARDMDRIRQLLGEEQVSYFGMSYGSELGAVWATMFPETVRAAVLDGAVDPEADTDESAIQQMKGFNDSVEAFLADCADDPACPLNQGAGPEAEFLRIRDAIVDEPIPGLPGRPDTNYAVWQTAVVLAMYSDQFWPQLRQALADASNGDGGALMELYDIYMQRRPDGGWGNELEAFTVITCADDADREGLDRTSVLLERLVDTAPLLHVPQEFPGYGCSLFPPAEDPRIDVTGADAGPILVVGTTGDAATPLASTERMAQSLENGVLLVVEALRHGGYGASACGDRFIHQYLVNLEVPASGTRCQ